jgi:polygalacturonase
MPGMRTIVVAAMILLAGCPSDPAVEPGVDAGGVGVIDAASDTDAPPAARVCDVRDFGAVGDGLAKDTAAIQAAIDACAPTGGVVSLHDGIFLSGTIRLATDITLDIAPTAVLRGSQNAADYPDVTPPFQNTQLGNCKKALVYAERTDRVRITGGGTIDGNARGVADWNGLRIPEAQRPMAIFVTASRDVTIEHLAVDDAATWAVVVMEVERAAIRDLVVDSDLGPTHDGIDIVDGHDVLVEDVTITSGDDSICLKSGSATGTEDVIVRRAHTRQSGVANGVKLGTASVGSFRRILVEDVLVENAQAAAMAVESVDGADIADVTFRRITTWNVGTPFFVLLGSRDRMPAQVGSIDGITFEDIRGTGMRYGWGSLVTGTAIDGQVFGISNIHFKHVDLTFKATTSTPSTVDNFPEYQGPVPGRPGVFYNRYPDAKFIAGTDGNENIAYAAPGFAIFQRHATGVTFESCRWRISGNDARPWLAVKD